MPHRILAAIALLCALATTAHAAQTCPASWYGYESGRVTAGGARFDPRQLTAAHRSLPFGPRIRVTYRGGSVVVTARTATRRQGPAAALICRKARHGRSDELGRRRLRHARRLALKDIAQLEQRVVD